MAIIAIYREATSRTKSTKSHILIRQDYSNRTQLSPNFGKDNILLTFENGKIKDKILFNRTELSSGSHQKPIHDLNLKGFDRSNGSKLLEKYEDLEEAHYKKIKDFYKTEKTKIKSEIHKKCSENNTKPPRIYTEYQGKKNETIKEFGVFFGGQEVTSGDKKQLESLDNPEFYNRCVVAAKKQLKVMGLSDKNLISINWDRDERTPHFSCRFSAFDFENCQSLNVTQKQQTTNKTHIQFRKNLLSKLQKTINESFGFDFEPKKADPSRKHKTKREWLVEQNKNLSVEQSKKQAQLSYFDNVITNKKEELAEEYLSFNFEKMAQKYTFKEAKEKLKELEEIGLKPATAGQSQNLIDLFLQFIRLQLGKRSEEYFEGKSSYLSIKNDAKNFVQPTIIKTIDKQIIR